MLKFGDICKLYGTDCASFIDYGTDRFKQLKTWAVNSIPETCMKQSKNKQSNPPFTT